MGKTDSEEKCPVYRALKVIGRKWTLLILREFQCGGPTRRYNELQRSLGGITSKVLSTRLQEMMDNGLIQRKVHANEVPVRVEYQLTRKGRSLEMVIDDIRVWGKKWAYGEKERALPCEVCRSEKGANC